MLLTFFSKMVLACCGYLLDGQHLLLFCMALIFTIFWIHVKYVWILDNVFIGLTFELLLLFLWIVYPHTVSTKYNILSLYSIQYELVNGLNVRIVVSMDIFVALMIIVDILVVSRWISLLNVVLIAFFLLTFMIAGTYDISTPNWIQINVEPISNGYLIIISIDTFVFTIIALILHTLQQGEQISIGLNFNQYAGCCISLNHNGTSIIARLKNEHLNYDTQDFEQTIIRSKPTIIRQ